MIANIPATDLPPTASPDMNNVFVKGTVLGKRPGYLQWGAGAVHATERVMGLFSTQDEDNATHFYAASQTQLKKYGSTDWSSAYSGPAHRWYRKSNAMGCVPEFRYLFSGHERRIEGAVWFDYLCSAER